MDGWFDNYYGIISHLSIIYFFVEDFGSDSLRKDFVSSWIGFSFTTGFLSFFFYNNFPTFMLSELVIYISLLLWDLSSRFLILPDGLVTVNEY